jgi:hypothetical protein
MKRRDFLKTIGVTWAALCGVGGTAPKKMDLRFGGQRREKTWAAIGGNHHALCGRILELLQICPGTVRLYVGVDIYSELKVHSQHGHNQHGCLFMRVERGEDQPWLIVLRFCGLPVDYLLSMPPRGIIFAGPDFKCIDFITDCRTVDDIPRTK